MVAIILKIGNGNCKSWSCELSSNSNFEMIGSFFLNIYMFIVYFRPVYVSKFVWYVWGQFRLLPMVCLILWQFDKLENIPCLGICQKDTSYFSE